MGRLLLRGNVVKKLRFPLALGLALCSLLAQGQSLPAPKEFYFDADPQTTRAIVALSGEGQEVVDRLAATVARRPDDVESRVQLARVAMQSGRLELGDELYQAAQRNAGSNQRLSRAVTWNYGWDLYRAGEPQRALEQWQKLIGGWPSTPGCWPAPAARPSATCAPPTAVPPCSRSWTTPAPTTWPLCARRCPSIWSRRH